MVSRRKLIAGTAVLASAAVGRLSTAMAAQTTGKTMRLGGPVFVKSDDPGILARAHRALGYRAAYAPAEMDVNDRARITAWVKEFANQDVAVAEVGAFRNILDPDPEKRRRNFAWVTERLALAEELGARNCVDIAGSYHPDVWYGPNPRNMSREFFDATVENCRKLIDAVKPRRTLFTIEMMPWSLPTGPDEYLTLIKAVDRKAFGVHLDVCNTMNSPVRLYNNASVIHECFQKLGRWIASCHAKDLQWGPGVQMYVQEVVPGTGIIDYKTYLTELSALPGDPPLMLEHLHSEDEYTRGRQYIQGVAQSVGLSFGD